MAKYVGSAKKHPKFEGAISAGLSEKDIETLRENLNERGWVNLIIGPQKENHDKYSIKIDEYKPQ